MCLFFSCNPYFKDACNQFGFGLISKSKNQLSISDNSDGSSTSKFSSTIFQKWPKTIFLEVTKKYEIKIRNYSENFYFVFKKPRNQFLKYILLVTVVHWHVCKSVLPSLRQPL